MATLLYRSATFRSGDQQKKTLFALNNQRNIAQFCDVILRVGGTQIFAHSNVLAAASPYFSSFLGTGTDCPRAFSQKQPQIIEIHIDSVLTNDGDGGYGEAVGKVVEYMYTNEINITSNLFAQIIEISRIMLLDELLSYCEDFQKGVDGNVPKSVSTCTSTLREVVDILGSHFKSYDKINAQTQTEKILFSKVSNNNESGVPENLTLSSSEFDLLLCDKITMSNVSVQDAKVDNSVDASSSHQVKNSSAFSVTGGETANPTTPNDSNDKNRSELRLVDNFNSLEDHEYTNEGKRIHVQNQDPFTGNSEPEENFNTIKSFDDILDCSSVSTEVPCNIIGHSTQKDTVGDQSDNGKPILLDECVSKTVTVTDVELEDISDLVTFTSLPSNSNGSRVPKSYYKKTGRPRGRPRKKKRGRPSGRREVDRSADYDAESDYEFEQFIHKLEKGENVHAADQGNEEVQKSKKVSINNQQPASSSDSLCTPLKKSKRVRSRPSVLREDYILHSLRRKSHRRQRSKEEDEEKCNNSGLRFMCQTCDYSTTVFKDYLQHMNSHPTTDTMTFKCSDCTFKTMKSRIFERHKQQHLAEKLICDFCLYQATDEDDFKLHKWKHSGDYPYFCTECDARFKKKSQLESHKPKHWIERPFICPVCKAGFKWKHALKNHMITHTTGKDLLCDICGYATAHKSMLTAHQLLHTGNTFKCAVEGCHFEATKRQKLKLHMLTHTREKPHQCEVCGQRFSLAKNMRRHRLLHSSARPFACKICSFKTTRYDKLKEHNHKSHNIGGPPSKRLKEDEEIQIPIDSNLITTVTVVTTGDKIKLEPDGSISAESLQQIAELAAGHQTSSSGHDDLSAARETIIKIEQPNPEDLTAPIMAHIEISQPEVEEVEATSLNLAEIE